jgi:outer membrane protein OmpA-like peptidoglycan-associated protein
MMVGINASKNYTYRENIVDGPLLFDNGTQQRNTSIGALAGINPRYLGIVLGTSYKFPIFKDEIFIKPLIQYTHALRPAQFGTNWYADALTFGLGIELHPFGEITKPKNVKSDNEELIPTVQSPISYSMKIGQVQSGKIHIYRKVYFMPVLHDLYPDILNTNEIYSSTLLNCIDDHGSCNYPWIIDTISRRMQQYPDKQLHIELNAGIDSELLIKKFQGVSSASNIDTSRFNFSYVQEQQTQKIGKIINEDLLSPYEMISSDTSYEYPAIQFEVQSNSEYTFDWGLYDLETKHIIKKGKARCNETILIDSIPGNFIRGTLRALIFEKENKKLIQSDIMMDRPDLVVSDPIQYETAALFDFNSDKLRNIDVKSLNYFMKGLKKEDTIIIEAFTDLSGDIALNTDLAKRRAESVSYIFTESPKEIILSPLKPRNTGKKEYQKAYNRIVTIKRKQP